MVLPNPLKRPFLVRNSETGLRTSSKVAPSTDKLPKKLSPDAMKVLLQTVREGERNTSRSIISTTLHVNDVVAEYCLRHLEEKLRQETDYETRVMQGIGGLPVSTSTDVMQFLRYAFGVQGAVSTAIARHLRANNGSTNS